VTTIPHPEIGLRLFGGRPDDVALRSATESITYAELALRVHRAAVSLGPARSLVKLSMRNDVDSVVGLLGALAAGHPVVLLGAEEAARHDEIARTYGGASELHPDLALLLSTSGTTGSPKLVRLSLDNLVAILPEEGSRAAEPAGPRRVALLGKPNVGKSSLLNQLAGEQRVVVDSVAGTTVDPVDELVEIAGTTWRFVDTAGIRKRVNEASGHEYYASLRTKSALDKAEVAVVLLEADQPLAEQDTRILSMVVESGRALVLAFNKWDLMDEERRKYLEREIERDLHQVSWAPRVNISAKTGRHTDKLVPALDRALDGWETRVPTSRLNAFLAQLVQSHPHPVRGGKQPRILFGTQATTKPPTFVLFTTGFLEAGYRRFIERRLREEFGFEGTPVRVNLRVREKRRRG